VRAAERRRESEWGHRAEGWCTVPFVAGALLAPFPARAQAAPIPIVVTMVRPAQR
jgi:hypothetical protein